MPKIEADSLRRGDVIMTGDSLPPKEVMRRSTEPLGPGNEPITEIKFVDGTALLTAQDTPFHVIKRF